MRGGEREEEKEGGIDTRKRKREGSKGRRKYLTLVLDGRLYANACFDRNLRTDAILKSEYISIAYHDIRGLEKGKRRGKGRGGGRKGGGKGGGAGGGDREEFITNPLSNDDAIGVFHRTRLLRFLLRRLDRCRL